MKEYQLFLLDGKWEMEYRSKDEYDLAEEPDVAGCIIENAVPGYWEDMIPSFQETFLYERLSWNPGYGPQRYPIAGYVPDMALPTVLGCFFYRRTIMLEDLSKASDIELFVGGAQNTVSAWINGKYLGIHRGYSAPFSFSVPKDALNEGENRVTLAVSNIRLRGYKERPVSGCTARAANDCTGGIYGSVELRAYYGSLRDAYVTVAEDMKSFTVRVLRTDSSSDVEVKIFDKGRELMSGVITDGSSSIDFSTEGLEFWSPDSPKRYTLSVSDSKSTITRLFGVRKLVAEGTKLRLNGKYIYARGICEHGYYPMTVHPPRDKSYYRNVIKTLKNLGFNLIRFHTWVPMPEYMEAADELGMLMEVETPNNTTYEEWQGIVAHCRTHTAVVAYSSGNEMIIDEDYIAHLEKCAALVHTTTDSLFSPMSAMRGIEYYEWGEDRVEKPFPHNPVRLNKLSQFCDLYNSYPHDGSLSYCSASANPKWIDECYSIYKKPILSHEICINGTYFDLSLKDRYRNSRIGQTALFSSVEEHLEKKGLLDRVPLYYRNSSEWQRRLRKQCFESVRRCENLTGYDYLGDIDHHWHTFGYCVGMMNEFYELKPGETVRNVRRYNSDAVLLADLPYNVNFYSGSKVMIPLHISNYGKSIDKATLNIRVYKEDKVYLRRSINLYDLPSGAITKLCDFSFVTPKSDTPHALKLSVVLCAGEIEVENEWELYSFPKVSYRPNVRKLRREQGLIVTEDIDEKSLVDALKSGKDVLLFGEGPFATLNTSFQIALAGRTAGHLATVISDSALMQDFPHEGFCSWQFRSMLDGGKSAVLDFADIPFEPIVEAVSTYKYAHREALVFEYRVGKGRLIVSTLRLDPSDPAAAWLKAKLLSYAQSEEFMPKHELSFEQLESLFNTNPIYVAENTNMARNTNDITA